MLAKMDPDDGTCTDLYTPGEYSVYRMAVSSTNSVTINALRYSDGAKVIANISPGGSLTLIDTSLNVQLTALERIN